MSEPPAPPGFDPIELTRMYWFWTGRREQAIVDRNHPGTIVGALAANMIAAVECGEIGTFGPEDSDLVKRKPA